ncbi:hypothetical protein A33K_12775 [Burkholderia humptydooensis MSMB43]|uniref:Uncharacterized protein n=1 Tax=Burkholderia humptydooensis MSMB43 TaxID=441157 RepID=A0ABN0GAT6_9BURK|nr:hypothetical protein A33K_12775 [Burkholderia humptydooensis MSMB43]
MHLDIHVSLQFQSQENTFTDAPHRSPCSTKITGHSPAALLYPPAPIKRAMHRMRGGLHVLARKCR